MKDDELTDFFIALKNVMAMREYKQFRVSPKFARKLIIQGDKYGLKCTDKLIPLCENGEIIYFDFNDKRIQIHIANINNWDIFSGRDYANHSRILNGDSFHKLKVYKENSSLVFEKDNGDKGYFNLANKEYAVCENGKTRHLKSLKKFFTHYRIYNLYSEGDIYQRLLYIIQMFHPKKESIQIILDHYEDYLMYEEMLLYPDLKVEIGVKGWEGGRAKLAWVLKRPLKWYGKTFIKNLVKYGIELNYEIERAASLHTNYVPDRSEKNELFFILSEIIFDDDYYRRVFLTHLLSEDFDFSVIKDYNLDLKTYLEYLDYLMRYEGLDFNNAVIYHKDYLSMTNDVMGHIDEKYPKMLISLHHIANVNFQEAHKELEVEKEEVFHRNIKCEDYKDLEYSDDDYLIKAPITVRDVIDEGNVLHHCVGSYVDLINSGLTRIYFLRKRKDPDVPFVTVEVKGGCLNQVSAVCNKRPDVDVLKFLNEFAAKFDLNPGRYGV